MTLESLTWIVIASGLVPLAGLIRIVRNHMMIVRDDRELARLIRDTAGLMYHDRPRAAR
jgi:hypothetical protein